MSCTEAGRTFSLEWGGRRIMLKKGEKRQTTLKYVRSQPSPDIRGGSGLLLFGSLCDVRRCSFFSMRDASGFPRIYKGKHTVEVGGLLLTGTREIHVTSNT